MAAPSVMDSAAINMYKAIKLIKKHNNYEH